MGSRAPGKASNPSGCSRDKFQRGIRNNVTNKDGKAHATADTTTHQVSGARGEGGGGGAGAIQAPVAAEGATNQAGAAVTGLQLQTVSKSVKDVLTSVNEHRRAT